MPCWVNPGRENAEPNVRREQNGRAVLGEQLVVCNATADEEIEAALTELSRQQISALIVGTDIFLNSRSDATVALAPAIRSGYLWFRRFALAGGLRSYGTNRLGHGPICRTLPELILKGEKPSDLPVQQATKVELVINLKTARALGIAFPLDCSVALTKLSNEAQAAS